MINVVGFLGGGGGGGGGGCCCFLCFISTNFASDISYSDVAGVFQRRTSRLFIHKLIQANNNEATKALYYCIFVMWFHQ